MDVGHLQDLTSSPLKRCTKAVGVATGATIPYHSDVHARCRASAKVGTSGSKRWRLRLAAANGRIWPDVMKGSRDGAAAPGVSA